MTLAIPGYVPGLIVLPGGSGGSSTPTVDVRTSGLGLQGMSLADYNDAGTAYTLSAGLFVCVLVPLVAGTTVAAVGAVLDTGGVTASGTNEMGLYTGAGVQVGLTGDMSTQFAATGYQTGALAVAYTVPTSGLYYVTALTHFSGSNAKILGDAAATSTAAFGPINGHYPSVYLTAQANSPASFNPAAANVNSAAYFLTAQ